MGKFLGIIFATLIILFALVLALLALFWPQERLADFIFISRSFDVMLPVLGVGALIKYLCCCGKKS